MPNNINRKKIVVIGSSEIVEDHIKVLKKIGLEITAIASSRLGSKNSSRIANKFNINKMYDSWKNLLNNELFDGILLASKIEKTYEIIQYALKYKKPILVEKPVSMNSNKLKKLIKNNNKFVLVGYNRRYYESVIFLKNYISKIKEKVIVNISIPERRNIRSFFSNSVHTIDIIHFIFGNLKEIKNKKLFNRNKLVGFSSIFESNKGDLINIIGNWGSSDNFVINIYSNNIKLTLCPLEILTIYKGIKITEPNNKISIRRYMPIIKRIILPENNNKKFKPGFYDQGMDFFKLINNKKISNNVANLNDSLRNIILCEKIAGKYKI